MAELLDIPQEQPTVQQEPLKNLYDEFNPKLNLAKNYDEFKQVMSDPKNRQAFFNEFNSKLNLAKNYDEFDNTLGLKKKDITTTPSTSTSLDGTSQSVSTPENFDINKALGTPKTGIGVLGNVSESTKVVQPLQTKHLANVLPVIKARAVKDITLQRLQKQGKPALVGSNDYNAEKEIVQNNIQDADWMPHDLLNPESQDKIKKEAVNNFASANNETPENIEKNIQNGKYKLEDGKIKEVGGFGDNFSQGVRDFVNNIGLSMNISAAQSRGNDNEIKYYLNEFNKNKKNEREITATDALGKSGKMLGGLTPYLAATAIAPYADVPLMGLSNLGENHQQIWNDPNLSEDQKIKAINNTSTDAFMIGNLEGMAFHSIGAGNEKTTANGLLSKYAPTANLKQKFTQNLYNSFGDLLKTTPSDVVKAASIGAGTELLNDMSKTKEGVKVDFSNVGESALQLGALDLIMKAPKVLTHAYGVLKDAVSSGYDKVNPDWYNQYSKQTQDALNAIVAAPDNIYKQAISQLDISPDPNAKNAKEKIETFRGYYNSLPSDLSNEAKNKALHILQLKTEAISDMNDAADDGIKKIYEGRAKAYDGILNKLVESGNVDTKKEPLLLQRFAATIPQKENAQPFIDEANKIQQPTETKITPTEEVNKPIGETEETKSTGEESIIPSEKGAGKFKPVKIAGTEVGEHGEDVNTEKGLENGTKDTELTNKGIEQSKDLGKYISEKGKTDIVSSEVGRAKKTAEIAADEAEKINRQDLPNVIEGTPLHESTKVNRTTNPLLNTWNIGEHDGKPVGSFDEEYYVNHPNEKLKGGESFNEFKDRMPDAYKAVEDMPKTTQVVAHSKVLRAFRALEETNKNRVKGEPVEWTPETTKKFLELKEQPTISEPKETLSKFNEADDINKERSKAKKIEAKKAFIEKHGEDANKVLDINNNFKKYTEALKEKGEIIKIEC